MSELHHYGIPGMKWGVRRYQNEDGSLTEAGKRRHLREDSQQKRFRANADKIVRGERLRGQGRTDEGAIVRGMVYTNLARNILSKVGKYAISKNKAANGGKLVDGSPIRKAIGVGKAAVTAAILGYQIKNISDMRAYDKYNNLYENGKVDELRHYGIPGMKWGIRRTPEELGHKPTRINEESLEARRKRSYEMSTDELNRSINRLRKEQEYNDLTTSDYKKAIQKVRKELINFGPVFAKTVVGATAVLLAKKYVTDKLAANGAKKT